MSKYKITLDGKVYEMEVELMDGTVPTPKKTTETPEKPTQVPSVVPVKAASSVSASPASSGNTVSSPMPGTILRVNAAPGDQVQQGQPILVLEAMKMENEISAPKAGKILALHVKQGDSVQGGDALFEVGE